MASKQSNLDKEASIEVSTSRPAVVKKTAGQLLRKARLAKGFKIVQVVQKLNISEEYIKAIENNTFEKLPVELSYSLGFVRAYAQILELDPKEIMDIFKVDFQGLTEVPQEDGAPMASTCKRKPTLPFVYIALAGGILILSMGYFASKKIRAPMPPLAAENIQVSPAQ